MEGAHGRSGVWRGAAWRGPAVRVRIAGTCARFFFVYSFFLICLSGVNISVYSLSMYIPIELIT